LKNADLHRFAEICVIFSGGEESRTPVQTWSAKAFYMLISLLIVGDEQETNKPIHHLAGWSYVAVTAFCNSILYLSLSRRRSVVTEQPASAALMTT
jgi:hypothetical protein